jgi:hypothetical protein
MDSHGLRFADLAAVTGKNVKTAQRWVYEGRTPRLPTRERIAQVLEADSVDLWPERSTKSFTRDLVRLYADVREIPSGLWLRMARTSTTSIDITLSDPLPMAELKDALTERILAGVRVRILLGWLASEPQIEGAEIRRSAITTLVYRCDDVMLVWTRCAAPGLDRVGPVLRLTRLAGNGVFDVYAEVFRSLWDSAAEVSTPRAG